MKKWAASAIIIGLFALLLFYLQLAGTSSRVYGKAYGLTEKGAPVYLVNTSADVYSLWRKKEVKGRVLVHMGRYLHFILPDDDEEIFLKSEDFPVKTGNLLSEYEKMLNDGNFLIVAIEGNVAREVVNVLPAPVFFEKRKAVEGQKGITAKDDLIVTHYWGAKRTILKWPQDMDEPVLLNIHASAFAFSEPALMMKELEKSGLRTDLITLCLAEENEAVEEDERQKLREFAGLLTK